MIRTPSFTGINATAAIMNGTGLANYGATVGGKWSGNAYYAKVLEMYSVLVGNVGDPGSPGYDALTDVDRELIETLQTLGNNREFGSGAFTTVVPGPSTSIGTGHLHNAVQSHTSRLFGTNALFMTQAIQNATGIVENSRILQPILSQASNTFFGSNPAENDITAYNSSHYYLGNTINNPVDMTLNGYNSIVINNNFTNTANDFIGLGNAFDLTRPATFGNPGQLCQAINNLEFASLIQLDVALINQGLAGVPVDKLDQPKYNDQVIAALAEITNREAVRVTKDMLKITNTQITKLSDIADFNKLFPNNSELVANTLVELQQDLQDLELGEFTTALQFGNFLNTLLIPTMPTRGNESNPVLGNNNDTVANVYLYQGRSIYLDDLMGTVAGIGITDAVDAYKTAIDELYSTGELTALYNAAQAVIDAAENTYVAPAVKNTAVQTALDSFTVQLVSLMSKENINSTITDAVVAWETVAAKCALEKSIESNFDLYLDDRMNDKNFALGFINSIEGSLALDARDREFLYGLANTAMNTGDSTGEYIHAFVTESSNYHHIVENQAKFSGGVPR